MNPIIVEAVKNRILVSIDGIDENDKPIYYIEGFYKSSKITLHEDVYGVLFAHARYNEVTKINSFRDLVELNHKWWLDYKDSFVGWRTPEDGWLQVMLKMGLVKEIIDRKITYE